MAGEHAVEVASGERFEFGRNWTHFLRSLTEKKIANAEQSLRDMLRVSSLEGKSFLDIGSGSGLFSLAARRLGATVHSFDFDPHSVACTQELKQRYFPGDVCWTVESGSVLDEAYLESLGLSDVVYSWGVLHHTGAMWTALENAGRRVAPRGKLFIAIYNDQGTASKRWLRVKQTYNRSPGLRKPLLWGSFLHLYWRPFVKDLIKLQPMRFVRDYGGGGEGRGMSLWPDLVDWVGGYPFEVAKPEQLFEFFRERGFQLGRMVTCNSLGCNEMVFERDS